MFEITSRAGYAVFCILVGTLAAAGGIAIAMAIQTIVSAINYYVGNIVVSWLILLIVGLGMFLLGRLFVGEYH